MQVDTHDRLVIPAAAPTLNRAEWGKDPGLESGFDLVLDRIQYLVESGLTSLMVMHNFLSRRLAPLQDRATRPRGCTPGRMTSCGWNAGQDQVWTTICWRRA
jgi:hypothetical protein